MQNGVNHPENSKIFTHAYYSGIRSLSLREWYNNVSYYNFALRTLMYSFQLQFMMFERKFLAAPHITSIFNSVMGKKYNREK